MFYCILCEAIHVTRLETDKVFTSGFKRLNDGRTIPLGIRTHCQVEALKLDNKSV